MRTKRPDRFGFLATLPMPDIPASVAEAERALDERGADGVVLLANNRGVYLGADGQDPLFCALEDRGAIVFIHSAELSCPAGDGIVPFAADFLLDTSRAAYLLVRNRVVSRYPNIRFILSHAGGFVPYAAHRMAVAIAADTGRTPLEALEDFQRFYFDTAVSPSPAVLPTLLAFARPSHILFGSDGRFAPTQAAQYFANGLDQHNLDPPTRAAIDHQNAARLFTERPARHRRRQARPCAHASPARRFIVPSPEQPSNSYNRAEATRLLTSGRSEQHRRRSPLRGREASRTSSRADADRGREFAPEVCLREAAKGRSNITAQGCGERRPAATRAAPTRTPPRGTPCG
jgi:predicted TIM-barrel fold metal-dependent hydrolase